MKVYKPIYSFEVLDKIKEGATVCVLDRQKETVEEVNEIEVGDFAEILNRCQKEKTRFDFWIVEEGHE